MSTPIPPNTELDGLDIYAPRRARSEPPNSQVSDPRTLTLAPECDQPKSDENNQASAADDKSASDAEMRIEDAIKAAIELARSLGDPEPAAPTLPPTANLRLPIGGLPSRPDDPPLQGYFAEPGPRRRFLLEPEVVPQPANAARRRAVAPMLVAAMVLGAAIIAYGFTIMPGFQVDSRSARRTNIPAAAPVPAPAPVAAPAPVPAAAPAPTLNETENASPPLARLVVENQKTFANEPLSLGVSVASATGSESLMLAGLALGTRLSAGTAVSDASWQLSSRDLTDVYVYAPKDFVGTMNTAIELLSPNKRLMETRAVQLEWIAKSKPAETSQQVGRGTVPATVKAIDPEMARLMDRGRDLLRSGDLASARLIFRHLADAGMADAALALAVTYDPKYIAEHGLIGVVGDETKARSWYQRASELGSTEAERILARTATK
jgi:TPR repeat protein